MRYILYVSIKTCNINLRVMTNNKNLSDTSFDIKIIHHLWVICSNNKVFVLPKDDLTILASNLCELTSQIEQNIGILCSQSDLQKIYEFRHSGNTIRGYILNLNFVEELKAFVVDRTNGRFLSKDELELLVLTDINPQIRESLLSLLAYLHSR